MTPRCGHCRYDLTGATGNRCPECGFLFIEAGVELDRPGGGGRRRLGLAIAIAAAVLIGGSLVLSITATYRARAARDRAMALRAAAMARQQAVQAPLNGRQETNGVTDSSAEDGESPD